MVTEQDAESTDEKTSSPVGASGLTLGGLTIHGNRAALFAALAKAQASYKPIQRTRTVEVQSSKGNYTFDYAPLEEVIDATLPALNAQGLAWTSFLAEGGKDASDLHTLLTHSEGGFIHVKESISRLKVQRDYKTNEERIVPCTEQEFGSKVTYRRRYQYGCVTGSSPEVDDDGNKADGNTVEATRKREPQRTPPTPPQKAPKDVGREVVASLPKEAQATFKRDDEAPVRPASVPPGAILNDEPINDEMIDRIKKAFAAKGMGARAATEFRNKVAGKTEGFTMADGEKVLHALRQEVTV